MSTAIEWTDETWNPVVGCERVSKGCDHCYAKEIHDKRHKAFLAGKDVAPQYAAPFETVQLMSERLDAPLHWRTPRRVFVNSVSDVFHEDVPDEFISRMWGVMSMAPRHTFQILTKRPERMAALVPQLADRHRPPDGSRWPLPNVWLGVSVENQACANYRIPLLLGTPAAVRFLSCEPLLGPVDLTSIGKFREEPLSALEECVGFVERPRVDWVIAGGESGAGARPMHAPWARHLRDQCVDARVPFFFKQWGAHDAFEVRVGKKRAGRELDGRKWDEFPAPKVSA